MKIPGLYRNLGRVSRTSQYVAMTSCAEVSSQRRQVPDEREDVPIPMFFGSVKMTFNWSEKSMPS